MGGGQSKDSQKFSNMVKTIQDTCTQAFFDSTNKCVTTHRASQHVLNRIQGDGSINFQGDINQKLNMVSYSSCKQQSNINQEVSQQMRASVQQKLNDQKEAMFATLQKGLEVAGDALNSISGRNVQKEFEMSNSTEFINKIQDSFDATWVNETLNTLTTQQSIENVLEGSGDINWEGAITQDVQGEQVNEAVQSTDVIKTLKQVQDVVAKQEAASKESFFLADILTNPIFLIVAGIVLGLLVVFWFILFRGRKNQRHNTQGNKQEVAQGVQVIRNNNNRMKR